MTRRRRAGAGRRPSARRAPSTSRAHGPLRLVARVGRHRAWRGRPRLRLVRPAGPKRIPFLLASCLLVGMCVFGVVVLQVLVSQTSFHMDRLTKQDAILQESHGKLELQVAQLSSPDRIAAEARRLGLIVPQDVQTITVGGGAGRGAVSPGQSGGGSP